MYNLASLSLKTIAECEGENASLCGESGRASVVPATDEQISGASALPEVTTTSGPQGSQEEQGCWRLPEGVRKAVQKVVEDRCSILVADQQMVESRIISKIV